MGKRIIKQSTFDFMLRELNYFKSQGLISSSQEEDMLSCYEVKEKHNFIRTVLVVGAILIGAGVLSFIASNWIYLSKLSKFLMIIVSVIATNLIGYNLENKFPKTSRALYYISIIIYGAGIFLVGQMFNLGGEYHNAFLLWSIGIIPIGLYLKDNLIHAFSVALLIVYSNIYFGNMGTSFPLISIITLPIVYYYLKKLSYYKLNTFITNSLVINLVLLALIDAFDHFQNDSLIVTGIMFVFGIVIYFIPFDEKVRQVINLQGIIIHWICGFILTFSGVWATFGNTNANIFFGIIYFIFALFLMNRGSLLSIAIVCSLILRFYIDLSYDFLPKSLVFIIGGLILIGFGYYFEQQRKKGESL